MTIGLRTKLWPNLCLTVSLVLILTLVLRPNFGLNFGLKKVKPTWQLLQVRQTFTSLIKSCYKHMGWDVVGYQCWQQTLAGPLWTCYQDVRLHSHLNNTQHKKPEPEKPKLQLVLQNWKPNQTQFWPSAHPGVCYVVLTRYTSVMNRELRWHIWYWLYTVKWTHTYRVCMLVI